MLSRVVPGIFVTMLLSSPSSALTSEDLPTFGLPTIATFNRESSSPFSSTINLSVTSSSRSPIFLPFNADTS